MLPLYKELLINQFQAALATLAACIEKCPEANWRMPVGNLEFSQVAFHALFYTDVYLSEDYASAKAQEFHQKNATVFGDYEETQDRPQKQSYEMDFIRSYIDHCREKVLPGH